jgi:hypothetical protein
MHPLWQRSGTRSLVNVMMNQRITDKGTMGRILCDPYIIDDGSNSVAYACSIGWAEKLWMLAQHLSPEPGTIPGDTGCIRSRPCRGTGHVDRETCVYV